MAIVVLDASVALCWCFFDEATPQTLQLLKRLDKDVAAVPELWLLEVGNILVGAERRNRISTAKLTEFIELLGQLMIVVDNETSRRAGREIIALARSYQLTTYDAAYLELSMRLGVPLATLDKPLQNAAKKAGVDIWLK